MKQTTTNPLLSSPLLVAPFSILLKRLRHHWALNLALLAGLTVAVALVVAIPLYANAVGYTILTQELAQGGTRPPFAFLFRYLGAWHGALEWEDIQAADVYLSEQVAGDLGLPAQAFVRHIRTEKWQLFPPLGNAGTYNDAHDPLAWLAIGFLDDFAEHIILIEGSPLPDVDAHVRADAHAVPVLVARPLADQLGLQVGEVYWLAAPDALQTPLTVHVTGIWQPVDIASTYWFYLPRNFDEVLLTTESLYQTHIAPLPHDMGLAAWYLVADGQAVTGPAVGRLQTRIAAVRARLDAVLPNLTLDQSPEAALQAYREETARLTTLLYAFGTPILGLLLIFVSLVAGMAVQRQLGEIVVLRSRGATRRDVVMVYAIQWGILGMLAWIIAGPLARYAAGVLLATRSFLRFAPLRGAVPTVRLDAYSWALGLIAVGLALLAALMPARRAARYTAVTHRQRTFTTARQPWWRRAYVDVLLLIPAFYGYSLLRQPSTTPLTQGDLFSNPLLFLIPTLFMLVWALLLLRLFPLAMAMLRRLSRVLRSPVPLLICHDLSEQMPRAAGPLLLLVLTSALATFSASLALTLDNHLVARTYYQVGADLRLVEQGEAISTDPAANASDAPAAAEDVEWIFLPIAEHRELSGVRGATRVGDYAATVTLGGSVEMGRYVGIDRLDAPGVLFFRDDFASVSLGALLNALAAERRGVLVDGRFLARHSLGIGDPLRITLDVLGERVELTLKIVGALDYFPTLYPENGPFFVGNLGYVFTRLGGLYPYDVWLTSDPGSTETIVSELGARGVPVVVTWDARARISEAQRQPQRQGLFGLLTLGFIAATVLTVLGLALHALLTFGERTIELGVLRAVGLSVTRMRRYLLGTQLTLLILGLGAGILLGMLTGQLFVPFLQVDAGLYPRTPPFIPLIAWTEIAFVAACFSVAALLTLGLTLILLRRMRLYEAIKLGQAV